MWLIWFVFLSLVMYVLYVLYQKNADKSSTNISPMDILRKRYIKGEISREEFNKILKEVDTKQ